jgi:hypothetical protein
MYFWLSDKTQRKPNKVIASLKHGKQTPKVDPNDVLDQLHNQKPVLWPRRTQAPNVTAGSLLQGVWVRWD